MKPLHSSLQLTARTLWRGRLRRWAWATPLLAIGLGLMGPASAQVSASVSAQVSAAGSQQFTLRNGMTVIVQPDRRAPTAVHMLWVRVGSMDEVDGTSGVAHVLEHMMFKGTATLKAGEFSRRVAAMGGRENAFTAKDYTGYFQQIPSSRLEDVMRLEADRFANNQWSDEDFRKELEVVKEERRLRTDDNPRARLYEALEALAWQTAPYRRPIVGWMSDLEAMTPDDARAFYRQWYSPSNAAVVVAGDVDPAQVAALAEKIYGQIPVRPIPMRKPRQEPPQNGIKRFEFKAPAEQAYVALHFKVPQLAPGVLQNEAALDATSQDALALAMLAAVLSGYENARLDRALTQGDDPLASSAGAYCGLTGRGPKACSLYAVPSTGKTAAQVESALRAEVARIARDGVGEGELTRVRNQWQAAEVYKLDSVFNQARILGVHWIEELPLDTDRRLMQLLRKITPAQVQSVAQRYFGDDALTVATLVPQPMGPARARPALPGARH